MVGKLLDTASYANYEDVKSTHIDIDWTIRWEERVFSGSVVHQVVALKDGVKEIVMDALHLDLGKIYVGGEVVKYELESGYERLGKALHIPFPEPLKSGQKAEIKIEYSTTKECTALGWLEANQTPSKKHSFFYSQCQAIHARSLVPCQDTPAVKITYNAKALSTAPVLFSALRKSPPSSAPPVYGTPVLYIYEQPIAIPSYLIACAAGSLAYAKLGERTGIWADPEVLESAAKEFGDHVETFVATAERLTKTPYVWEKYDILILPPSFPFGGMENPTLTFATPTLITGDHSCVDVVAHEISHSWFGNDLTSRTWEHFWLNEGWTTYLEHLILGELEGHPIRGFAYYSQVKPLREDLALMAKTPQYQRLVVPYQDGTDPDDGYCRVPYDKGSMFLYYIEQLVGGLDVFLPYVNHYVQTFRGQSITTWQWKDSLYDYFTKNNPDAVKKLDQIDWDGWFHGEGLDLPVKLEFDATLAVQCNKLAQRWKDAYSDPEKAEFDQSDIQSFSANQKTAFLQELTTADPMPKALVHKMNSVYALDQVNNAEIRLPWYQIALKAGEFKNEAAAWVKDKGRMKFSRPIFRSLYALDPEFAVKHWKENRDFFHPIARSQIDRDLHLVSK